MRDLRFLIEISNLAQTLPNACRNKHKAAQNDLLWLQRFAFHLVY